MAEKDDDIYFLPSLYNYKHIDNGYYNYYGDTDKCEDLERDLNKDFEGVEDFCMRTTGILNNFDKLNFNTDIDKDKCEIVNYWVYNYLFNRIKKKNGGDPFEILGKIFTFRKEILESSEGGDKTEKCVIREELNDKNNFKKMKILFDYITDYKTIKLNIDKDDFACSTPYKNYINKGVSTYNSIKADCKGEGDKPNYCYLLSNSNIKNDHEKLAELQCIREKSTDAPPSPARVLETQDLDSHPPGPGDDQLRLQRQGKQYSPRTMQQHEHPAAEFPARDELSPLPLQDENQLSTADGESAPPKGAFMTTVFPTVGSLFFFSMIYKFTPIGSKLRSFLRKSKIIRHSENKQDAYGLMQYPFELDNANYPLSAYGVGYQASRNS